MRALMAPLVDGSYGALVDDLRARYGVTLADALQLACALTAGCDVFLTNDERLRRVSEISVLLVSELERGA